jgi:putative peptidoglycan lipid II flippase
MRLKSIFTNSFGILFSRVTGLGRDVLMASALGASVWSDMFFVAFKLPNLFRRIFAEGAFTQAFMPSFVASRHKGVFATAIFLRFLLFLMAISLLITFFPEPITKLLAWGWDSDQVGQTAPMTAINFWYLDLIFIVTFLATLLQYKNHFATTAMSTALLNISMIAALYIYMKEDPKTVAYALSFAVLIGGALQVLVHLIAVRKFSLHKILLGGWKYRKTKNVKEEKKHFQSLFLPGILGNSTPQISAFIDTILATFLMTGSVSYLFYANRIFQLPLAIIAIATATSFLASYIFVRCCHDRRYFTG